MATPITATPPHRYTGEDADMMPEPMVELVIRLTVADADRLAAHSRERSPLGLLSSEAREVATPVVDALVAADFGGAG